MDEQKISRIKAGGIDKGGEGRTGIAAGGIYRGSKGKPSRNTKSDFHC